MNRLCYYKFLTISLVIVLCLSRVDAENKNNRIIIGGVVVNETNAGWHVAIIYKRVLVCSGSLIRRNIVVTAASCIIDLTINDLVIRAGSINFKSGGQIRKLEKIAVHPEFKLGDNSNNIALINLRKPLDNKNGYIKTLRIPTEEYEELPSAMSVYGWGISDIHINNYLTKKLRVAKFKVYSERKCLLYLPNNHRERIENVICMGDRTKKVDICNDDIGTGAISKQYNILYGIVSTNGACAVNHTIIATAVAPHTTWISSILLEWQIA
ncbi:Kallikrein 1-related peptidase b11 [Lucilia cuprina]|nr:Kallikrein 1-related peptidase b11 [Lucilia cuprina]